MSTTNPPKPKPATVAVPDQRLRLTVDVPPAVLALLDHYCECSGRPRGGAVRAAGRAFTRSKRSG